MITDIRAYVNLLNTLKITPNQYLLIELIYRNEIAALYEFVRETDGFDREEVEDLVRKGYLMDINNSNEGYHDMMFLSEEFERKLFLEDREAAAEQFWGAYPDFIYFNQSRHLAKTTDKEAFMRNYYQKYGRIAAMHKKMMRCLEYGKKHGLITMGIEKYISSQQYLTIDRLMRAEETKVEMPHERIV